MGKINLPYLHTFQTRYGKVLAYYRRDGRQLRVPGEIGSRNFFAAYNAIHPILADELEQVRREQTLRAEERSARNRQAALGMTIVQRENGAPYTEDGFGTVWNREQHRVGCAGLPFHGLRKNATVAMFEAGCTLQQVQAITGHETLKMVQHYGKGARQKLLAKEAMKRLTGESDDGTDEER